ncbi:MAG: hypothetical protein OEU26_24890, partial [Candidatus Tectomicrobia bacterium]|nr:hypothetical protein [Candidatus Tectomicrobia bacterium]
MDVIVIHHYLNEVILQLPCFHTIHRIGNDHGKGIVFILVVPWERYHFCIWRCGLLHKLNKFLWHRFH